MSLKIGVALGGGGARGIAHIAYLNALDELDIKPDVIVGTGVGALIGGLYASGKSPADIVELLEEIDYRKSMKILNNYTFKEGKYGVLDFIGLEEYLELVMPVKNFDRLYTPLKVVAANYETKEQHIFEEGNIVSAIRASIAIPGIFSPVEVDQEFFVDGGCVNPLPADVIRDECDILIAIDVTGEGTDNEISVASTANDLAQCYQILTKQLLEEKSKNVKIDILAKTELYGVQMLDLFNYENILEGVDEEVERFKYEVAKLVKPELLEKARTKSKKKEKDQEDEIIKTVKKPNKDLEEQEAIESEEAYDEEEFEQYELDEDTLVDENAEMMAEIAALEEKLKQAKGVSKSSKKAVKVTKKVEKSQSEQPEDFEKPINKRQVKRLAKKEALARLEQEILQKLENQ